MRRVPRIGSLVTVALLLVHVVVFHRFWNHSIVFRDSFHNFAPYKFLLADALRSGSFPAWYPWSFLGMPFAGNPEAACFYPLNFLYVILPFEVAHRSYILVHYPLAAVFLAWFLRGRGLGPAPSMLGGLAYSLSGYMTSQHATVTMVVGAAWAPLALAFADRALRGPASWALGAGAVMAVQVLGGEAQSAYVTAALVAALCLASARRAPRRALGVLAAAGGISAVLGAIQIVPGVEMMERTARGGGFALEDSTIFSFHPARLVELVWSGAFGSHWPEFTFWGRFALDGPYNTPWSITNYVGLPVLTLALIGVWCGSRRLRIGVGVGAVVFLAIAMGRHTPLYGFLHEIVPMFDRFRYPAKYLVWFTLCVAVAAAMGLECVLRWIEKRPVSLVRAAGVYAAAVALTTAISVFVWPSIVERETGAGPGMQAYAVAIEGLKAGGIRFLAVNLIAGAAIIFIARNLVPIRLGIAMVIAVLVADWTLANVSAMPAGPPGIFAFRSAAAAALEPAGRPTPGRYRVFREEMDFRDPDPSLAHSPLVRRRIWDRNTLRRNFDAMEGFEGLVGYSGSKLAGGLDLLKEHLSPPMLEIFNVRYVIASFGRPPFRSVRSEVVHSDVEHDFSILHLPDALPRAYWVEAARRARDDDHALELLRSSGVRGAVILVDTGDESPASGGAIVPAAVRLYENDRVVVETDVERDGWLVLSDRYFPGWTARLDGETVPIRKANLMVRAVRIPAGPHTVEFRYVPWSLRIGAAVSLAGWLGIGAVCVVAWRRRRGS